MLDQVWTALSTFIEKQIKQKKVRTGREPLSRCHGPQYRLTGRPAPSARQHPELWQIHLPGQEREGGPA